MSASPFPDIRPIRQVTLSILGFAYIALAIGVLLMGDGQTEPMLFLAGILAGMWVLQWAVLAGEAQPQRRGSIGMVILLALAFGALDAILVGGWNALAVTAFGWIDVGENGDWFGFFALIGFVFGVVMVAFTGWRLPKFEFIRLMFWMHVIGCALQGLLLFLRPDHQEYVQQDHLHTGMMEVLGGMGIVFTAVVLWWGITPAVYLIAYRDYRRRLAVASELHLAEPEEVV